MAFKLVIGDKGKAWRAEIEGDSLIGKSIGDKVSGKEIKAELDGYGLEITGGSDLAGFPLMKGAVGIGLKSVLLKKGWGMRDNTEGIRRRKTVRGQTISEDAVQINMKVVKHGSKKLDDIFPDQNKKEESKKEEPKLEEKKAEEKTEKKAEVVVPAV